MAQAQFRKGNMTAWLLPVVLVLSLFTFSGTNSSATTKPYRATTEQVELIRITTKKCATFSNVPSQSIPFDRAEGVQRIAVHNLLVKIRFDNCAQRCNGFVPMRQFLLAALQRSAEEFIVSQIG